MTFRVALWPKQLRFFRATDRYAALIGGIGSGKSHAGVVSDIVYALTEPGSLQLIVGPTLVNLKQTTMRKFFELLPRQLIQKWRVGDRHLTLVNGSEFLFWGADDEGTIERMRGLELARFHVDEAALVAAIIFNVLIGRLRQKRPDGTSYPHQGRFTTTHKGKDWLYGYFEPDDPHRKPIGFIEHTSIFDNEDLPPEYVADVVARYGETEWAKQELWGGHAKFEGLMYPAFDRATHVWRGPLPPFKRIVFGIDWGFHNAPVLAIGITHDDQRIVAAEYYGRNVTLDQQLGIAPDASGEMQGALGLCRHLDVKPERVDCYPDPSRPENIVTWQQKGKGLRCPVYERGHITEGVLEVARYLRIRADGKPGLMFHESAVWTLAEIEGYQRKQRKGLALDDPNRFEEEPAPGQVDHAMDALRYGFQGLKEPGYATNAIAYMRQVSPTCEGCGERFHWPLSAREATCPRCGHKHERR